MLTGFTSLYAEVPRIIEVHGRMLSTDGMSGLTGTEKRNFLVKIVPVSQSSQTIPTFTQTINDVTVENGQFSFPLDLSTGVGPQLLFDTPYTLQISVGPRAVGGLLGDQILASKPYAFTADNALSLGSRPPSAYITAHSHDRMNIQSFTIDGSRETRSNIDQFIIKNSVRTANDTIFRVNEDGELRSIGGLVASSGIFTRQGFQIRNGTQLMLFMDNLGDMTTPTTPSGELSIGRSLLVSGSMVNTNNASNVFQNLNLTGLMSLQVGSVVTGVNLNQIIGQSHTLEQHLNEGASSLLSSLTTMLSGGLADDLHTHVFNNREVKSLPLNLIDSARIQDGTIMGDKFMVGANISDSKLAQIVTSGKIALSALPVDVARLGSNNSFKVPFPISQTDFDNFQSKSFSLISTLDDRLAGAFPLISFSDRPGPAGSLFEYRLMSSGDVLYSRPALPNTSFSIVSPDLKLLTYLSGTNTKIQQSGIFAASVIASDSVSNEDFADSSISSNSLLDGDVQGADLADSSITVNALGVLGTDAFAVEGILNSRIANFSLTDADFMPGAFNATHIQDEGIGFADIAVRTLSASKLTLGSIERSRFSSGGIKPLLNEDFADRSISGNKVSSEVARRIDNSKIAASVFQARTQPVRLTSADSTVMVTLKDTTITEYNYANTNNPVFLSLKLPQFVGSATGRPLEVTNNNGVVFAFRNDNRLQLSYPSGGAMMAVTIGPEALAVLAGVSDTSGFCGNRDSAMRPMNGALGASLRTADCVSSQRNHGLGELQYSDATNFCASNGYRVCSVTQYYRACRLGLIEKQRTYMTQDYASTGRVTGFQVANNDNRCAATNGTDYTITSVADNTNQSFYCCLR